jgi:hypothetical protein
VLVVLAACGPKATTPGPTSEPIGTTKLVAAPTRDDCTRAVDDEWPTDYVDSVDIAAPNPARARAACLLQRNENGSHDIRLTAIVGDDGAWRAGSSLSVSYPEGAIPGGEQRVESHMELFAISPNESAIRWETVRMRDEEASTWTERRVLLVRISDEGELEELFEMDHESTTGESDDIWTKLVSATETMTGGYYDLEVEIRHQTADWDEETSKERWRWDGAAYSLSR